MSLALAAAGAAAYPAVLFYALRGTLGFGLRLGRHLYAEEGFGPCARPASSGPPCCSAAGWPAPRGSSGGPPDVRFPSRWI